MLPFFTLKNVVQSKNLQAEIKSPPKYNIQNMSEKCVLCTFSCFAWEIC